MSDLKKTLEDLKQNPELFKSRAFQTLQEEGLVDAEFLELVNSMNPAELDMFIKMRPGMENAAIQCLIIEMFKRLFTGDDRKKMLNEVEKTLTKACDVASRYKNTPGIGPILNSLGADTDKISRIAARMALADLIRKVDGKF